VASVKGVELSSATECVTWLQGLDRGLVAVGQATTIVARTSAGSIFGASVGDSEAWLVRAHEVVELTERQDRKPLLGSGLARPVPFGPVPCDAQLLLASDGLFKYVAHDRIRHIVRTYPLLEAADVLIAAARLRSGNLQDDVALILSA
jgi:serine/threonine protein phosphatase PrpC